MYTVHNGLCIWQNLKIVLQLLPFIHTHTHIHQRVVKGNTHHNHHHHQSSLSPTRTTHTMPYSKSPNTGGNSTVINMGQSPSSDNDMSRPSMPRSPHTIATTSNVSTTASHMVKEYRNIIRHILSKIHKRRRPPTALAQLAELYRLSALSSDDPVQEFDHDDTVDLLIQLRTSLMLCEKHELGPDILYYQYV